MDGTHGARISRVALPGAGQITDDIRQTILFLKQIDDFCDKDTSLSIYSAKLIFGAVLTNQVDLGTEQAICLAVESLPHDAARV